MSSDCVVSYVEETFLVCAIGGLQHCRRFKYLLTDCAYRDFIANSYKLVIWSISHRALAQRQWLIKFDNGRFELIVSILCPNSSIFFTSAVESGDDAEDTHRVLTLRTSQTDCRYVLDRDAYTCRMTLCLDVSIL